jgi:hypothetical protein
MRTIHTEIAIAAPAAKVWEILVANDKWPEWNPFLKLSGRIAPGERVTIVLTPPGKRATTFHPTVIRLDPGREFRWLGSLGMRGLFDGEHGFRVVPESAGRCRLEQFETFKGLLVTPILGMMGDATRQGFEAMNQGLKARAEAARRMPPRRG